VFVFVFCLLVGWLFFVFSTHFFYRRDCMSTILILQQILTLDLTATALPLARPTVKQKTWFSGHFDCICPLFSLLGFDCEFIILTFRFWFTFGQHQTDTTLPALSFVE